MSSTYFNPQLCANTIDGAQCTKLADRFACSNCRLVQYCSKECQAAHWPTHKKDTCKHELMSKDWMPNYAKEKRLPTFADGSQNGMDIFGPLKYLWGQEPALDLINLAKNEGLEDLSRDLDILCAASGDPRHVFKTIASLPENYTGKCTVVTNDADMDIVARTAIFLLIASYMEPEEAVPAIIHLWYSALLPSLMLSNVCDKIAPLIEDVCTKIAAKANNAPLGKTFKLPSGSSIRIVFTKEQWFRLWNYFTLPPGVTRVFAKEVLTNPHATLLLYFAGSNKEMQMDLTGLEKSRLWRAAWDRTARYLPIPNPRTTPRWHPDNFRFEQCSGSVMFDWDAMWSKFQQVVGLRALLQDAGLRMRRPDEHRVARAWPKRMKVETKEQFDVRLGKDATGYERYVELFRAR